MGKKQRLHLVEDAGITKKAFKYDKNYEQWLKALNYNKGTLYYDPLMVREFTGWLQQNNKRPDKETLEAYLDYLQSRDHKMRSSRLKENTIRAHHQALKRYGKYLKVTGRESYDVPQLPPKSKIQSITVLTRDEIEELYQITEDDPLGIRDRAMLSVYYGCGLRRSEGAALEMEDVQLSKGLLHVRKGKHYKGRHVPVGGRAKSDLEEYIKHGRPKLLQGESRKLFIGRTGKAMQGTALADRFKTLLTRAGTEKQAGLHTLRHSIATHLLQSGMTLEQISRFLGHSSLESTQVYTHIAGEE